MSIGLKDWVRPLAYCEIDKYAQGVLLSRMADGLLPVAPIWDDIRTFPTKELPGHVDIIYGGFPCQDISIAGVGKGLDGERSGLFKELFRLVQEAQPRFCFLENVPAIRTRGSEYIGKRLAAAGYDCRWDVVSASQVGAPHKRERWFLLAHTKSNGNKRNYREFSATPEKPESEKQRHEFNGSCKNETNGIEFDLWKTEPCVGRMVDGLPFGSHRIKSLGNAVVPIQVKTAFKKLCGLK